VIENLSGVGYEEYIHSNVLAPAGAVNFTMQNGDPKPTRYYRGMFPEPNGVPELPAPGVDFADDFSVDGRAGALGWYGSPAEYALFLRLLMGHSPTQQSRPIVREHIGFGFESTPAGSIFTGNGEWVPYGDGAFFGCFFIFPDRTTVVAMTNSYIANFQGLIKDAIFSVFPSLDQPRIFLLPMARYGGRLGDLRYTTDGSDVGNSSPKLTVDSALQLSAAAPHVKIAVFDGEDIVTPPIDVSGSPALNRAAEPVAATVPGLRFLRFPWTKPNAPDVPSAPREGTSPDLSVAIASEQNAQSFAYAWWGYVKAPDDGTYTFATSSDDGSVVWIDDVRVVDNDGYHSAGERQGMPVALRAGKHPIRIAYFNGQGAANFQLRWITPGKTSTVMVPVNLLSS
jgi:hypothetical protein